MSGSIQAFPDGTQVRQEPKENLPKPRSFELTKFWWRFRQCGKYWLRGVYFPLLSAGALFGFLSIPFFIFFMSAFAGQKGMLDESRVIFATGLAAIFALPFWAIINLFSAPVRVILEERKSGAWNGKRFVYYQPKLIGITEVSPVDNGKYAKLDVENIPSGVVVDYKLEVEGAARCVNCIIFGAYFITPQMELLKSFHFALRGRVVLPKNRALRLLSYSPEKTLPVIIRAYAIAWEHDPNVLMEYTDEGKGFRFLVGPPGSNRDEQKGA